MSTSVYKLRTERSQALVLLSIKIFHALSYRLKGSQIPAFLHMLPSEQIQVQGNIRRP